MNETKSRDGVLVVGIGSPFGDDTIGWRAIDALRESRMEFRLVKTRTPIDLLDAIEGVRLMHVVDACCGSDVGRIHRWEWPFVHPDGLGWLSTHGVDAISTLNLGESLGILPNNVVVWGIECDARRLASQASLPEQLSPGLPEAILAWRIQLLHELGREPS